MEMVWIRDKTRPRACGDLLFQQWLDETGFRRASKKAKIASIAKNII